MRRRIVFVSICIRRFLAALVENQKPRRGMTDSRIGCINSAIKRFYQETV